jgi:hypothetical protein
MIKQYQIIPKSSNYYLMKYSYDGITWRYVENPWNGGLEALSFFSEEDCKSYIDSLIAEELAQKRREDRRSEFEARNPPISYP